MMAAIETAYTDWQNESLEEILESMSTQLKTLELDLEKVYVENPKASVVVFKIWIALQSLRKKIDDLSIQKDYDRNNNRLKP